MTVAAPHAAATALGTELTWGGSLAVTSDYIYRGLSESNGRAALQADLHADTPQGTFAGAWASTRDRALEPGAGYDFEIYLGHRFDLSSAWNATLSARSHYFPGATGEVSDDFQELSAVLTWLDRWTLSASAIPNAVRYWYYRRLSRSPAGIAETTAQWLTWTWFVLSRHPDVEARLHDELEWTEAERFPYYSGVWRSPQEVLNKLLVPLVRDWEGFSAEARDFVAEGDRVVALGTYAGTFKATGRAMTAAFAHVWTVREGRAVQDGATFALPSSR